MTLKQISWAVLLTLTALPSAWAIQPGALPSFTLTGLDGKSIASSKLAPSTQWLILYIQADCKSCETVLQLVKQKDQHPNLQKRLVIIGGMTLAQLKALAQKYPELSTSLWAADSSKTAFKLLKLPGTPIVVGIKRTTVMWNVNGVMKDTRQYKSILESWTD